MELHTDRDRALAERESEGAEASAERESEGAAASAERESEGAEAAFSLLFRSLALIKWSYIQTVTVRLQWG
jgi:hypothetical protein